MFKNACCLRLTEKICNTNLLYMQYLVSNFRPRTMRDYGNCLGNNRSCRALSVRNNWYETFDAIEKQNSEFFISKIDNV